MVCRTENLGDVDGGCRDRFTARATAETVSAAVRNAGRGAVQCPRCRVPARRRAGAGGIIASAGRTSRLFAVQEGQTMQLPPLPAWLDLHPGSTFRGPNGRFR